MHRKTLLAAALIAGLGTSAAHADIVTYTGNTTNDPTYNHPVEDLSGLSQGTGSATHYDAYSFSVGAAGIYNVTVTGTYDTFAVLYQSGFSPASGLTNAVGANNDLLAPPFIDRTSGFSYALTPGISYTLVTTGFANADRGLFSATIGGAGTITPASVVTSVATPTLFTRTATTSGQPSFDRPIESLGSLSDVGTATPYDLLHFKVDTSGTYTFVTNGLFDTFDFLYGGAFDPLNPLLGVQADNDDLLGVGTSGFASDLVAGVDYYFVTTGYANTDAGLFALTIGGPGTVSAIPEPDALALMLSGVGLMGFVARRRKAPARLAGGSIG
jgi:hypothetical protein